MPNLHLTRSRRWPLALGLALLASIAGGSATAGEGKKKRVKIEPLPPTGKIELSESDWKDRLTEEQFQVLRKGKTERAFSGEYWKHTEKGVYLCAACNQILYSSEAKYDAGNGFPSFSKPIDGAAIDTHAATAFGMMRVKVECSRCQSHLGYAYDDGPAPTGMRHTLNSIALIFETPGETAKRLAREKRSR